MPSPDGAGLQQHLRQAVHEAALAQAVQRVELERELRELEVLNRTVRRAVPETAVHEAEVERAVRGKRRASPKPAGSWPRRIGRARTSQQRTCTYLPSRRLPQHSAPPRTLVPFEATAQLGHQLVTRGELGLHRRHLGRGLG